jgi:SAM-dependent methyltransferase
MRACLEFMDPRAEIVGVDASAAMIRIARANVLDPRARFQIVRARDIHKRLSPTFDRIVCNAAFWEFPDRKRVLTAIALLLTPEGSLVFNVPADRIQGADAPIHPFQFALGRQLQRWDHGPPEPLRAVSLPLLRESAAASGLDLWRHDRTVFSCRQRELMALMTVPPLIRPLTPALTDHERTTVVTTASRQVDPDEQVAVPWHFFSFRKLESPLLDSPAPDTYIPWNHDPEGPSCDTSTW